MNNLEKTLRAAMVSLPLMAAGCENSKYDCGKDARVVNGACLENQFSNIEEMRLKCGGAIRQQMIGENLQQGGGTPVWKCDLEIHPDAI